MEELGGPIGQFVRERCEVGAQYEVAVEALYLGWKNWCEANGRTHPGTRARFARDLRTVLLTSKLVNPPIPTRLAARVRIVQGVRLSGVEEAM